jgi:hypothetical protein
MKKIILISILLLIYFTTVSAQVGSSGIADPKSAGLAGTYNTFATGSYALGINPANIIMSDRKADLLFILPIPQVNFRAGTDFMTVNDLNYFFGGVDGEPRLLSARDVDRLNSLFDGGGEAGFGLNVNLLSFTFKLPGKSGAFGFSINDFIGGNFIIPQALVEIPLKGNLINKAYSFEEANFKTWWTRNYSLSYAREIPLPPRGLFNKLTGGISIKLIHGYFYAGTENVNTHFVTGDRSEITGFSDFLAYTSFSEDIGVNYDFDSTDNSETDLHIFPSPGGTGFGVDIGFSAIYKKLWNFSLALTDIGSISWKKRTAQFLAKGDIFLNDVTSKEQRDTILERLTGEGTYVNGFSTGLPLALRLGTSYSFINDRDDIPGNLIVAFDYNQGFNDLPGNSTIPRFSVAGDWKPGNWIPSIRMGFSFGGLTGFSWAAGLGINAGILEFNIATTDFQSIATPNSSRKLSFAINSRWIFY